MSLACSRDGDAYRLGVPGLAMIRIEEAGRRVTFGPLAELSTETIEHLLVDQVLPRVLTHCSRLVLHAGCVAAAGGALAFLGESGVGKSTLCAALARTGSPLLSDDAIVALETASGFDAVSTYPGLRLLPDPLDALFGPSARGDAVAHYTKKRRVNPNADAIELVPGPLPLRALYVLAEGPRVAVDPLEGTGAFLALVRSSFLLHLADRERSREQFERLSALSDAVPVRRLAYPRDLAQLPAVVDALLADGARYLELASAS